jgi:hypothetical protein
MLVAPADRLIGSASSTDTDTEYDGDVLTVVVADTVVIPAELSESCTVPPVPMLLTV